MEPRAPRGGGHPKQGPGPTQVQGQARAAGFTCPPHPATSPSGQQRRLPSLGGALKFLKCIREQTPPLPRTHPGPRSTPCLGCLLCLREFTPFSSPNALLFSGTESLALLAPKQPKILPLKISLLGTTLILSPHCSLCLSCPSLETRMDKRRLALHPSTPSSNLHPIYKTGGAVTCHCVARGLPRA